MPNYYLKRDGEDHGPYPTEELKRKVAIGDIKSDELVRPEDGEDWIPVGSFIKPVAPRATMLGHSHSHSDSVAATRTRRPVTLEQVKQAKMKLSLPIVGMILSCLLPLIAWQIKSKEGSGIAADSSNLFPLTVFVGLIGFATFLLWFRKAQKHANVIKTCYEHGR